MIYGGYSKASCRDRGGDINAQIGRNVGAYDNGKIWNYGIRKTNPQGEDQIEWLTGLWVNSFFYLKNRGTWFNRSNKT